MRATDAGLRKRLKQLQERLRDERSLSERRAKHLRNLLAPAFSRHPDSVMSLWNDLVLNRPYPWEQQ